MPLEPKGHPNGEPSRGPELTLARWSTRFWAWLVDFIIVSIAIEIVFAIAYAPLAFNQGVQGNPGLGAVRFAVQSLLFFAYWTYFESTNSGQSIGKKLLTELWQSILTANRCLLWLDIYKRKETEAVQPGKRYDSNKETIGGCKDDGQQSHVCQSSGFIAHKEF